MQWLRLGDQQLHIFQRPTSAPALHHLAMDVEDLDAAALDESVVGRPGRVAGVPEAVLYLDR